jgi:hypothetical protein
MGWSPFRATGLTHHFAPQSYKGYTLVTPTGGDSTYLLDMAGQVVHRWSLPDLRGWYARLQPDGTLLATGVDLKITPQPLSETAAPGFEQQIRHLGGCYTRIQTMDWDGDVLWSYDNIAIHHDFLRLANGNLLLPLWVELPEDFARGVRGGFRQRPQPKLISDDIIEIDADGREVNRIHLWQLLDPVADPICPLEARTEWTHLNGIALDREGGLVFSCRNNSRVGIIDPSRTKLTWKYGFPNLTHQHHPTVLPNGNIQIFDNGMHRHGAPRSSVIEVNPKDSSTAWRYVAEPEAQFFSSHISGAERQPNDNTLICEGGPGRVFEVTRRGEIVWEWISPFAPRIGVRSSIFRAHRYSPDFPGLHGKELDPERYAQLNRMYGLAG